MVPLVSVEGVVASQSGRGRRDGETVEREEHGATRLGRSHLGRAQWKGT
jgi:hypothetical protein